MAWPTSVATDADLYLAIGNFSTTLNGSINNSQTTITLVSTSGLPTAGILLIDAEKVRYTGVSGASITGCTRGFGGTSATSHTSGATVKFIVAKEHHNALKDELIAIETDLSTRIGFNTGPGTLDLAGDIQLHDDKKLIVGDSGNVWLKFDSGSSELSLISDSSIRFSFDDGFSNGYINLNGSNIFLNSPGGISLTAPGLGGINLFSTGAGNISIATNTPSGGNLHLMDITHNTTDTTGFMCIPVVNGTPTGTPSELMGNFNFPMVYDRSGNKLWVYNSNIPAWKFAAFS